MLIRPLVKWLRRYPLKVDEFNSRTGDLLGYSQIGKAQDSGSWMFGFEPQYLNNKEMS